MIAGHAMVAWPAAYGDRVVMILDLHRQGLSVSAIARQLGVDRKTVRTYLAKGLGVADLQERAATPGMVDPFEPYLRDRLTTYPGLTVVRLWGRSSRRLAATARCGIACATFVLPACQDSKCASRRCRASRPRWTARFDVEFTDEPGAKRMVWLFSMVLGAI